MSETNLVSDGQVVSMDYVLRVDGQVFDQSQPGEPLKFIQGRGQIIRGLERALLGMAVGERKTVVVSPKEGYGEANPKAFAKVPRDRFPPDVALQVGLQMQMRDPGGQMVGAAVERIEADHVVMNLNHPLAGKELHFEVTIAALRAATPAELSQGRVLA